MNISLNNQIHTFFKSLTAIGRWWKIPLKTWPNPPFPINVEKLSVDFSSSKPLNSRTLSEKVETRLSINVATLMSILLMLFWPSEEWCSTFSVDGVQSLGWFPTATAPGIEVVNYIAAPQYSEQFATYFLKWRYEYFDWRKSAVLQMLSCYEHSSGACWHLDNKGSMFRQFMEYAIHVPLSIFTLINTSSLRYACNNAMHSKHSKFATTQDQYTEIRQDSYHSLIRSHQTSMYVVLRHVLLLIAMPFFPVLYSSWCTCPVFDIL